MTPANFEQFQPRPTQYGVDYILIGGGAASAQGLARATYDVDIIYSRRPENLSKRVAAIGDLEPYYRGAPRGRPFRWDRAMLAAD